MNENVRGALTAMPNKRPPSDSTGPMGMQPVGLGPTTATQTLPAMPGAKDETKGVAKAEGPQRKPRTRTEAVRVALARITRRKSLRKQRKAQKG